MQQGKLLAVICAKGHDKDKWGLWLRDSLGQSSRSKGILQIRADREQKVSLMGWGMEGNSTFLSFGKSCQDMIDCILWPASKTSQHLNTLYFRDGGGGGQNWVHDLQLYMLSWKHSNNTVLLLWLSHPWLWFFSHASIPLFNPIIPLILSLCFWKLLIIKLFT